MSQNTNPETPKRTRVYVKSPQTTPTRYRTSESKALGDLAYNVVGVNPFNVTSKLKSPMAKKVRKTEKAEAIEAVEEEEGEEDVDMEKDQVEDTLGEYRAWFEERFGSLTYDKDALGWFLAGWTSTESGLSDTSSIPSKPTRIVN